MFVGSVGGEVDAAALGGLRCGWGVMKPRAERIPRVAVASFGEGPGISPRVEAQRRENRRWAASFIEAFWRRNQPSGDRTRRDDIDYHVLAVATVGGLFEVVTDWLHEADPARPRKIDSLISELAMFVSVVEDGITSGAVPAESRRPPDMDH